MGTIVGMGSGSTRSVNLSNYYTKDEVDLLTDIDLSVFELVETLPSGDAINTSKVYLVKDTENSTDDLTVYTQKKYVDGAWSILGSYKTSIDLSGYVEKETGKGLFSGSYNDLTNKPNLGLYVTLATDQTITSNKTFTNALKIQDDGHILSTTSAGAIRLFGGTSLSDGASFIFHGKDYSDNNWKGAFDIIARNGTTYKQLTGKPDGSLTWDGKSLVTTDSLNNYVTLATDLTISGSKTFSKDIILKSATGDSLGAFRTNGSNELIISDGKAIYFRNTNEKISTTDHGFKLEFINLSGTETSALKPETNEGLNIGLSDYQFNNIYGKTIYLNGKLVANKEDLNSYETSQHASDTYVKKSSISTKELVFIKEDGSTETVKSIVEV